MSRTLNEIKAQIAQEYEATRRLEPDKWLARHPEWRGELASFFAVFGPALASAAAKPVPRWHDASGTLRRIQENTRRIAAIRAADRAEAALGAAVASRAAPMLVAPLRGRDRWKVAKTAVFTWIVDTVRRVRPGSPGRFDANKAAYLMERILELDLFRGFRPEKLGMWNPVLLQLEREAAKRRWLAGSSRGDRFSAGPKLDEALAIARERLSDPELADRVMVHLARNQPQLELWGMVDYAAEKLTGAGQRITAPAIVQFCLGTPEWAWKTALLPEVPLALEHLIRLEIIPAELVDFPEEEE